MRLIGFGGGRVGIVEGDDILDLTDAWQGREGSAPTPDRLVGRGLEQALAAVASARPRASRRSLGDVVVDAPVRTPSKIIAAPINYRDHQEEMRQRFDVSGLGVFLKAPSSLIGHGSTIQLPYYDRRFDHEGELAVVIGRECSKVPVGEARHVVFGYTCLLDITMRGGEDRSTRKSFDTFTPLGPWIVTADELPDPSHLELTCAVDGVVRQKANTSELIWNVDELIAYASSVMTLKPGDIISTGTPAGVSEIVDGQVVDVTIEGIGSLVVGVSSAGAVRCPTRGSEHGPIAPKAPT